MGTISIILRRPPYGTVDAAEAVRHALGGIIEDMEVNLILVDGGIQAARARQVVEGSEYAAVGEGIKDCIDMGVSVHAERLSLKEEQVEPEDLVEGVAVASGSDIAELIGKSDTIMVF